MQQTQSPSSSTPGSNLANTMNPNTNPSFFGANEEMFGTMFGVPQGPIDGANGFHNGFLASNEWDLAGNMGLGAGTEADMTTWNQMLDSINMTWDGMGEAAAGTEHANR